MKKLIIYSLLLIVTTGHVFAQKDADAKVILNAVSKKYRSYNVVKTDFTLTVDNQQAGVKETQTGTLIVIPKNNKFKVTLYSKGATKSGIEQEIISDGKSQWTYLKKDKEVQLNNVDKSGDGFNPAQMFTIYEKGYKYLYTGSQKVGSNTYKVIDLTPEDTKKPFFKVRLLIDNVKKQIYSALIFDKNGNKYNYTLRTFTPNIPVADNTFTFDTKAHPGVEVVDLR